MTTQLTSFLNEFKSLINLLISLLTTVIDKLIEKKSYVNNQTPPLSILLWNANGITHNKNEFQHLLYEKKINIALITETHLIPNKYFNISGYTTH
jgi:hypothetical protein